MPPAFCLALGSVHEQTCGSPVVWGLLDALDRQGERAQLFQSRACFGLGGAGVITGSHPRHLDSWLMDADQCREVYWRGAQHADWAILHGQLIGQAAPHGGGLTETVCQWLDLPRIAIVDAGRLSHCISPRRPEAIAGILVDRAPVGKDWSRLQTQLEAVWGVPVLGGVEEVPAVRQLLTSPCGGAALTRDAFRAFGDSFLAKTSLSRLQAIAKSPVVPPALAPRTAPRGQSPICVAVAYDDAFHGYFPDTLDALESAGAKIVDFSPLRDDRLPLGVDVIYFGCGRPQHFAEPLAQNLCFLASLKQFALNGGRIYAEGGGLAFLCQHIILPNGNQLPMSGVLSADAVLNVSPGLPEPVELRMTEDCWLARRDTLLRGYRSPKWKIVPTGPLTRLSASGEESIDFVAQQNVLASRVHFHFAALPQRIAAFCSAVASS